MSAGSWVAVLTDGDVWYVRNRKTFELLRVYALHHKNDKELAHRIADRLNKTEESK